MLRLQIVANPHSYQFGFKLGGQLITTQNYNRNDEFTEEELATLDQAQQEFKEKYPDIDPYAKVTIKLPESRPFPVLLDYLKNLVVTQQTSLCSLPGDYGSRRLKRNLCPLLRLPHWHPA